LYINHLSPYKIKLLTQIYFRLKGHLLGQTGDKRIGLILYILQASESVNCIYKKLFRSYGIKGKWKLSSKNVFLYLNIRNVYGLKYNRYNIKLNIKMNNKYKFYIEGDENKYDILDGTWQTQNNTITPLTLNKLFKATETVNSCDIPNIFSCINKNYNNDIINWIEERKKNLKKE